MTISTQDASSADILSWGGAPGTATMVSNVPFDPILDADLLDLRRGYSAHSGTQAQSRRARSTN